MLDPKFADGFVGMGKREAICGVGMSEESGVEVQAQIISLRPVNPVLKVFGLELVSIHALAASFGVSGMKVYAMLAGNEGESFFQVVAQFIGCARASRVVASHRKPAAKLRAQLFKPSDIVALPAVKGDLDP